MRHDEDRALVGDEVFLQPGDRLGIEVVGRFVEQQHVGRFEKELRQSHAAALAARERLDIGIVGRAAQRVHRDADGGVEFPQVLRVDLILKVRHLVGRLVGIVHGEFVVAVEDRLLLGDAEHDVALHVQSRVEHRFLRQVADLGPFGGPCLAFEIGIDAGHDAQQRRFTRAIDADNPDLDAWQKVQVYVLETFLAPGISLGDAFHVIDVLIGCHGFAPSMRMGLRGVLAPRAARGNRA